MKNEHSNDKPKLCLCCESKVFSIQQHITPSCELENNIKDTDRLYQILYKYFNLNDIPCVCCFYRDIEHFINVENTVNRMDDNKSFTVKEIVSVLEDSDHLDDARMFFEENERRAKGEMK